MEKLTLKDGTSAPFTLSQCAQYDAETRAKERITAWGALSAARCESGKSRRAKRAAKADRVQTALMDASRLGGNS